MRLSLIILTLLMFACVSPSLTTAERREGDFVKVAFVGDTGTGFGFGRILDLVRAEKIDLLVVLGDTDYGGTEAGWDKMVRDKLGDEAALVVFGNHDYKDSNVNKIAELGLKRLEKRPDVTCKGKYGEQMTCALKNVHFVLSSIPYGKITRAQHEEFIDKELKASPEGSWRICAWHANQNKMQLGNKADEVGWTAYETCRKHGAIVASAHEHSYARSYALKDMTGQVRASEDPKNIELKPGVSFVFVSGLGGRSIRDQKRTGNHWASVYTANQRADYGVLFGEFKEKTAKFYFKTIYGNVVDEFAVSKSY